MLKKLCYTLLWYSVFNRFAFNGGDIYIHESTFYYQCNINHVDMIVTEWYSVKFHSCYFDNVRIFIPSDFTNVPENITWCKLFRYKDQQELQYLRQK